MELYAGSEARALYQHAQHLRRMRALAPRLCQLEQHLAAVAGGHERDEDRRGARPVCFMRAAARG